MTEKGGGKRREETQSRHTDDTRRQDSRRQQVKPQELKASSSESRIQNVDIQHTNRKDTADLHFMDISNQKRRTDVNVRITERRGDEILEGQKDRREEQSMAASSSAPQRNERREHSRYTSTKLSFSFLFLNHPQKFVLVFSKFWQIIHIRRLYYFNPF